MDRNNQRDSVVALHFETWDGGGCLYFKARLVGAWQRLHTTYGGTAESIGLQWHCTPLCKRVNDANTPYTLNNRFVDR